MCTCGLSSPFCSVLVSVPCLHAHTTARSNSALAGSRDQIGILFGLELAACPNTSNQIHLCLADGVSAPAWTHIKLHVLWLRMPPPSASFEEQRLLMWLHTVSNIICLPSKNIAQHPLRHGSLCGTFSLLPQGPSASRSGLTPLKAEHAAVHDTGNSVQQLPISGYSGEGGIQVLQSCPWAVAMPTVGTMWQLGCCGKARQSSMALPLLLWSCCLWQFTSAWPCRRPLIFPQQLQAEDALLSCR